MSKAFRFHAFLPLPAQSVLYMLKIYLKDVEDDN